MKNLRKMVPVLLAIVLAASLVFTGCGSQDSGKAQTTSSPAEATTQAGTEKEPTLAPYEVSLVYPGGEQPDHPNVVAEINKILAPINATLLVTPVEWGQWSQRVNLMIASQEKFDLLFTPQWLGYSVNVSKGALLPLNVLLEKYGQGIVSSLDPLFLEGTKINGKNYAIPTNKELAATGGFLYRSDIADELGLDMSSVKTLQDLDAIFKVVKEKKPDMTPFYTQKGAFTAGWLLQFDSLGDDSTPGVILRDGDSTKVTPIYEQPRYLEAIKLARDYMSKGYINLDAATTTQPASAAMGAGNVFMFASSLKPGKDAETASALNLVGKIKQIELTSATVSTGDTAGSMLGISSTSTDPDRAMMVLNLMHTDKALINLMNFGIENVHYTKVSDNVIKINSEVEESRKYYPGTNWMFGNQFNNYLLDNEDPQKWEKFAAFNKSAKPSPALGFTFDSELVKTELGATINIDAEFRPGLDSGSVDINTVLPKYIERLKAAGEEKVIAEKQKQLDEFLAQKK